MREQLIHYVDLLFAGAEDAAEIKQEILQNTLDRYDDLVEQGKSPEAAYRLAISGIGDINEILTAGIPEEPVKPQDGEEDRKRKNMLHTIATAAWILVPIPLFLIQNEVGLCLTLVLVSLATALNVYAGKLRSSDTRGSADSTKKQEYTPKQELRRSISMVMGLLSLGAYIAVGLALDMWLITLLIFPLFAAVKGVIFACMDLKEANEYEN